MHGQQYKCPHCVTTGSFAVSRQMLHSKIDGYESSELTEEADARCLLSSYGAAGCWLTFEVSVAAGLED